MVEIPERGPVLQQLPQRSIELNALQVKNIIMESVTKVNPRVKISEGGSSKKVLFSDLSITGGVVNAYNALQLAEKVAKGTAQVGK